MVIKILVAQQLGLTVYKIVINGTLLTVTYDQEYAAAIKGRIESEYCAPENQARQNKQGVKR
jgi:hypothetical protein